MRKPRNIHLFAILIAILSALGVFGGAHAADRMRVTVMGQGPDVVLIPGLASSAAVWDATVKSLSATHRVHVVQVAGFAGAPVAGNAEGAVVEPLVEAVDDYIKSAKLTSPAVVGHSLGGFAGLLLAQRHPEHVGRLLVVDSLPFFATLMSPAATVEAVRPQAAAMRDAIAAMDAATFERQQAMTLPRMVKSPEGLKAALEWSKTSDRGAVARALYDLMTTDARPGLAAMKTPVTVLYPFDPAMGASAAMVDGLYGNAYAALPGVSLKRIDGARHFIMLDEPQAFVAAVEAFLR